MRIQSLLGKRRFDFLKKGSQPPLFWDPFKRTSCPVFFGKQYFSEAAIERYELSEILPMTQRYEAGGRPYFELQLFDDPSEWQAERARLKPLYERFPRVIDVDKFQKRANACKSYDEFDDVMDRMHDELRGDQQG